MPLVPHGFLFRVAYPCLYLPDLPREGDDLLDLPEAPLATGNAVAFQCLHRAGGYLLEAYLPAAVLNGFDPEQNPRLGFFYAVRDRERGEQTLGLGSDFPYAEDPSLWGVLELV